MTAPTEPADAVATRPRFSLVIPIFNSDPEHLAAMLTSVSGQSWGDLECVVVDDGSDEPEPARLAQKIAEADPRFRVLVSETNGGIAAATNRAIAAATGEWIVFGDHDDRLDPGALQRLVDHQQAYPDDELIYTDEAVIDETGAVQVTHRKPVFSAERLLGQNYLAHLVAVRRELLDRVAIGPGAWLDPRFEPCQDNDLVLRATEAARGVGHVPEVLYSWRAVPGSLASAADRKAGVATAVAAATRAALRRRGEDALVETIADSPTTVRVHRPAPAGINVARVAFEPDLSTEELSRRIDAAIAEQHLGGSDAVLLEPIGASWFAHHREDAADADDDPLGPLIAQLARAGVGACGPRVITADQMLVSAGRIHLPRARDLGAGEPAGAHGPWGAYLVAREVASLAPAGLVFRVDAYRSVGGVLAPWPQAGGGSPLRRLITSRTRPPVSAPGPDAMIAALATRMRQQGWVSIWTPLSTMTVPDAFVDTPDLAARRDADLDRVHPLVPGLFDDPYAPIGAYRDPRPGDTGSPDRTHGTGTESDPKSDPGIIPIAQAAGMIRRGAVSMVTCDVFDTLVWRPVAEPDHLFALVADRLHDAGLLAAHVRRAEFAEGRTLAEARARVEAVRAHGHHEVTLAEISAQLPDGWLTGPRDAVMRVEVEVEGEHLRRDDEVISLLGMAAAEGLPTVLVSDVYLNPDQLIEVLGRAGVPLEVIDEVVTSSAHRLGKADGLLERVIRAHGQDPAMVLHLGDNPISDVAAARRLGARVVATDLDPAARVANGVVDALRVHSAAAATDGGVTAAVRTALIHTDPDPASQFGAAVGGPLLAGFAAWAADTATSFGVDRIHYLLREGATLASLAGRIRPEGPEARLVHVSRWVNMRAAVIEGSAYEIARAVLRRATLEARHLTDCFGVDVAEVERVIGVGAIPDDRRWGAFEAIAADQALREQILEASARLRTRVLRHLDAALEPTVIDGREHLVLCDIGWGGTIQEGIDAVLRAAGRPVEVIGLYLLLSEPGLERVHSGARMLSYLPSDGDHRRLAAVVSRNPELLEELCTPPLPTLVDFDESGDPVLVEVPDHAPESRARARHGVEVFTEIAVSRGLLAPDRPLVRDPGIRSALLEGVAATLQAPDPRLAAELSRWSHDDVAGTAAEALVTGDWDRALPYLDAATATGVSMREIFWLAGSAAMSNPTLAAQLDAIRRGVDPEALCPPSELGEALIAVYRPGAEEAAVLLERHPTVGAAGWMFQRLDGAVPAVRDVRVDFGDRAGLVQLAYLEIRCRDAEGRIETWEITDTSDRRLRHLDARPISADLLAVGPEGSIVIPIPPELGDTCRHIWVRCAYRSWATELPGPLGWMRSVTAGAATVAARPVRDRLRRLTGRLLHRWSPRR